MKRTKKENPNRPWTAEELLDFFDAALEHMASEARHSKIFTQLIKGSSLGAMLSGWLGLAAVPGIGWAAIVGGGSLYMISLLREQSKVGQMRPIPFSKAGLHNLGAALGSIDLQDMPEDEYHYQLIGDKLVYAMLTLVREPLAVYLASSEFKSAEQQQIELSQIQRHFNRFLGSHITDDPENVYSIPGLNNYTELVKFVVCNKTQRAALLVRRRELAMQMETEAEEDVQEPDYLEQAEADLVSVETTNRLEEARRALEVSPVEVIPRETEMPSTPLSVQPEIPRARKSAPMPEVMPTATDFAVLPTPQIPQKKTMSRDTLAFSLLQNPYLSYAILGRQRCGKTYLASKMTRLYRNHYDAEIFHINLGTFQDKEGIAEDHAYWQHAHSVQLDLTKADELSVKKAMGEAEAFRQHWINHDNSIFVIDEWAFACNKVNKFRPILDPFFNELASNMAALTSTGIKRHKALWAIFPNYVASSQTEAGNLTVKSMVPILMTPNPSPVASQIEVGGFQIETDTCVFDQFKRNWPSAWRDLDGALNDADLAQAPRLALFNGAWIATGECSEVSVGKGSRYVSRDVRESLLASLNLPEAGSIEDIVVDYLKRNSGRSFKAHELKSNIAVLKNRDTQEVYEILDSMALKKWLSVDNMESLVSDRHHFIKE